MRRTCGARSASTTRETRSSRPGGGALSGQPDIDGVGVANRSRARGQLARMSDKPGEGLAIGVCVQLGAHPNRREAHRLGTDVAGAPHRGDVEISLQLQLERGDGDALRDCVRVDADRDAGAERGEQGLGRVGCGVVPEKLRRLVHHVRGEVADEVELPEARLGDGAALDRADLAGIGLALVDEGVQALLVDGCELGHGVDSCWAFGAGRIDSSGSPGCTTPSSWSTSARSATNPSLLRQRGRLSGTGMIRWIRPGDGAITTMRSARKTDSSTSWVTKRIVFERSAAIRAISSCRRMPESWWGWCPEKASRPTSRRYSSAMPRRRARGTPPTSRPYSTLPSTLRQG